MPRTLVFVHAHPDDEALLTAGTMARAVAEGHRVVLVVATDGEAGLAAAVYASDLAERRRSELAESARRIGVHRVERLGYADSGLRAERRDGFAHHDRDPIIRTLAAIVDEERADVLVGYDAGGGYGHPDHVQVHRVARAVADIAIRRPQLFEATLPREPIARAARLAARLRLTPRDFDPREFERAWTPGEAITHRVDVRRFVPLKVAALTAHASQATSDGGPTRTIAVLLRLPRLVQRALLGSEYFIAVDGSKGSPAGEPARRNVML